MSYSKNRLEEALRVIREDNERRHANEAKRIAETQYREGFNFRRSAAVRGSLVAIGQSDNTSDDEYDPDSKKRNNKRKKSENLNVSSKKQKTETSLSYTPDEIIADTTHAFITLKLSTEKGRWSLAGVEQHQKTCRNSHRNENTNSDSALSRWQELSGGLHRVDRSMVEQSQDFEVAHHSRTTIAEPPLESAQPRTLRNGKIREHIPKKRKKDGDLEGFDTSPNTSEIKRQKIDKLPKVPTTPTEKTQPQGDVIDDAISIASTSSTETTTKSPPTTPPTPYLASSASPQSRPDSHITTLRTCFAHPINFQSLNPATCSFHTDYRHPILGHGAVTGQYLIFTAQPSQLIELDGGHRLRNPDLPSDTMCIACALSYLQIIRCPRHTFTRLAPNPSLAADGGYLYAHDMLTSLKRGDPNRTTTTPIAESCSLCPSPAVWKCCSPQLTDKMRRPCRLPNETLDAARLRITSSSPHNSTSTPTPPMNTSDPQIQPPLHGCGLALCGTCHPLIQTHCDGRMQNHRSTILREVRMRRLGARADIEFLFREGLVWKAYHVDDNKRKGRS